MAEADHSATIERLKTVHLFRGLSASDLAEIAPMFTRVQFPAGMTIFHEGDRGDYFYIIDSGTAEIKQFKTQGVQALMAGTQRRAGRALRSLGILHPGDFFGTGALLTGRRRSATITAQAALTVLRIDEGNFLRLISLVPSVKPRLALTVDTFRKVRGRGFDWLDADEVILIFATKHWYLLARSMILPTVVSVAMALVFVALIFTLGLVWLDSFFIPVAGLLILWYILVYIDWINDYYAVTNRRVVHEEHILLIYEARVEAPLYTLRNVMVKRDTFMRMLNFGDVVLQTFAGAITFDGVPHPQVLADLALEMVSREKVRQAQSERTAIRGELLKQMGFAAPARTAVPMEATAPVVRRRRPSALSINDLLYSIAGVFSLKTRVEEQGVITYRKHPFVLITEAKWPLLGLGTLLLLLATVLLFGWFAGDGLVALCAGEGVVALPLLALLIYRYEDWRNDIYQITSDTIFDIERQPFLGKEERRQAPLEAVLNVQVNRPDFWANVLNYGNVIVQTGGKTGEMTFDNVFDPLAIQQDIWRKFESLQTQKRESESARRRAEMAVWFAEFHKVLQDTPPKGTA